jgi:large-conductance mechanosensitive channel
MDWRSIKKKAQMNKFVIGAIIFVILVFIIFLIIKRQTSGQEGLLSAIFGMRP